MTDDIVKRLRSWDHCWPARWLEGATAEAAAEIERLRAELASEREQFHDGVLCHSAETLKLTAARDALRAVLAKIRRDYSSAFMPEDAARIDAALKGDDRE